MLHKCLAQQSVSVDSVHKYMKALHQQADLGSKLLDTCIHVCSGKGWFIQPLNKILITFPFCGNRIHSSAYRINDIYVGKKAVDWKGKKCKVLVKRNT